MWYFRKSGYHKTKKNSDDLSNYSDRDHVTNGQRDSRTDRTAAQSPFLPHGATGWHRSLFPQPSPRVQTWDFTTRPQIWGLVHHVECLSLPSLGAFKRALKTELFRRSYGNANYQPQQHWHYSCSVIRDT